MGETSGCNSGNALSNSVFKNLTNSELELLNSEKRCSFHKRGEILYKEGSRINGVYCIESGVAKIYKTGSDGKEQIIAFGTKGDIAGYRSVLSNEPACTTAEILHDAHICFIQSSAIFSIVHTNGNFALALLQLICRELNQANSIIKDFAQKTVRERLAEALLMLSQKFGSSPDGHLSITLTREEIANIIGTATESVIRLLSEFRSEKIISIDGRRIKIENIRVLEKLSKSLY